MSVLSFIAKMITPLAETVAIATYSPHVADMAGKTEYEVSSYAFEHFKHTLDDIKHIGYDTSGTVKLYHGAPQVFAEFLVAKGPYVPYNVEDMAIEVAKLYGIPWIQFKKYALRKHEVVQKLSTAPAPIAVRWASTKLGEVLSDLNEKARWVKEINRRKKLPEYKNTAEDDIGEVMYMEAMKNSELYPKYSSYSDLLNLPDKFKHDKRGALIELTVDIRGIPDSTKKYARTCLNRKYTDDQIVYDWNDNYQDIKIAPSAIKSAKIVMKNIDYMLWEV